MNVAARDCIFIPCCVYIPAEPPLMGLESLKMCFSRPGMLLAGRMCRDLCIFDAVWGGVELLKRCMTYLESHGIQTSRHGTEREKSLPHSCVCVCHSDVFRVCSCTLFFLLPAGVNEQGISHCRTHIKYRVTRACFLCLNFSLYFASKCVSRFLC